ncbi:hypothetical protein CsSME_00003135 [Camellia sinensis var. sinensis]
MEIDMGKLPFDIDFHPSNPLVSADHRYQYAADSPPQRLLEAHAHSESCRAVRFINEGRGIVTGSPDCSILATDVETGSAIACLENSHGAAVNRITNLTESTIASGDGEGCIKVWDTRQRTCSNSFNAHEEYISDMTFAFDSMRLLGTRYLIHNGRKVICGTQTGTLLLYLWGFFKDCSFFDRYVDLSPNSVDALLKLDEDRVISGSENGLISLVGILPNRIIQPIAEHSEYPVERLAFSHGKKLLGSISHGSYIEGITIKSHSAVADSDSDEMDEMDMDMDIAVNIKLYFFNSVNLRVNFTL